MKKIHVFQITLILIFLIFLIFLFTPTNYTKTYEVNKVEIKESYNKENKSYYFTFFYKDITFDYLIEDNYKHQRTFIKDINIIEDEKNFCLIPESKTYTFYPLCYQDNSIIHYSLANNKLKDKLNTKLFKKDKLLDTYKDIDIYNKDYTYLIWNYTGFNYINEDTSKELKLFDKEHYNINLIAYTKDYLVIADYNSEYTFDKFYTIDFKKGKLKEHDLKYDIYFDSYFPGYSKNDLYIIDNKNKLMYEFNAKNGDISKTKSKILNRDEWEEVNIKTLINQDKVFTYKTNYEYTFKDNSLYLNYYQKDIKTLISNNITSIVRTLDKDIFYLKEDILYHFNPELGEEKLLAYPEWNFNSNNIIYLN